jgi:hypothetical protein
MVIMRIVGGLGNQMFQYALGKKLAVSRGYDLRLDKSSFAVYRDHNYELDKLKTVEIMAPEKIYEWSRTQGRRLYWLVNLFKRRPRMNFVTERGLPFDARYLDVSDDSYLDGYWQTERYFSDIREVLLKEFEPKSMSAGALQLAEEISSDKCAISVHVRRGDYVSNAGANQVHGTCDPDYYDRAVAHLEGLGLQPTFYVFSDDIAWAKANLLVGKSAKFIDGYKNYEDMRLMSLCRHNIIANSSFSWWGAWLNNHLDKIVIAPSRWFRKEGMDARDIIPSSWLKI